MKGTAELLLIDGLEPMQLFRMVATPNGTTEAGWAVMEKRGVPPAISDAIVAASKRDAELAAESAKAGGYGGRQQSSRVRHLPLFSSYNTFSDVVRCCDIPVPTRS